MKLNAIDGGKENLLCLSFVLTLYLLTWKIWWAQNNASRWQMGFNLVFKGLNIIRNAFCVIDWIPLAIRYVWLLADWSNFQSTGKIEPRF